MAGLNMFPMMVILLLANCALPTLAHLDDSPAIKYAFDVYNYIFKGKKIGDFSCRALVALGKPCHNVFVNSTFTYEHTGNRTAIQARADRVFNHYAFDVYNYIFKGKKIGDFSCRALVALGKPCHNVFVNSTFTYEHTGNRTAIQARADRVFNHCIIATSVPPPSSLSNLGCSSHLKHVRNYCLLYGYSYDRDILGNSDTFIVSGSKIRMMKTSLRRIAQIVYKTRLK
ncbi:hypothetical protein DVH24_027497 [Malus domestica]|uniref:Prolamin-like domain-containing protein n=1 Tax=Malus domestica TaxID=3750 RepID=A0A498KLY0_MALDO|nr:hypothetical protein DVH24_027497 [Malus domestica]